MGGLKFQISEKCFLTRIANAATERLEEVDDALAASLGRQVDGLVVVAVLLTHRSTGFQKHLE